eukprot:CAMPEP_0117592370 /NCGR_PEP_ID=MMETSP0784-20121206/72042_1 /TAXON_ID=39447 /ORGANISM="" /LENGTH=333 /DNA_ID=CAMNT_0005394179 /DNA_START=91 /DNA_END=1089 /DNA_ORIENTATION=+
MAPLCKASARRLTLLAERAPRCIVNLCAGLRPAEEFRKAREEQPKVGKNGRRRPDASADRQNRNQGRAAGKVAPESWAEINERFREPGSFANIGTYQIRRPLAAIPFLVLGVVADLGGSMRFLLSLNPELARQYRLDSIYPLARSGDSPLLCAVQPSGCRKRYYAGTPYSCTFSYPGDWSQDLSVEAARQLQDGPREFTMRMPRKGAAVRPLPLAALGPIDGAGREGLSLSLYTRPSRAATLADALGSPKEALHDLMDRFVEQAPWRNGQPPIAEAVAAEEVMDGVELAYHFEYNFHYPGDGMEDALSAWTAALFAPGVDGGVPQVLLLVGVA